MKNVMKGTKKLFEFYSKGKNRVLFHVSASLTMGEVIEMLEEFILRQRLRTLGITKHAKWYNTDPKRTQREYNKLKKSKSIKTSSN